MQASNIDYTYARLSWQHIQTIPQSIVGEARKYAADLERNMMLGMGLTLWGDRRGTGKTMLTTLILKEAMAAGKKVYFSRFYDLIESYSRTWKDAEEAEWFRSRVERCDLLGIDDMGKESAQTDASIGMIDQFIDRILRGRVANCRVTMATSNLDPDSDQGFGRYQQDVLELLSEVNQTLEVGGTSFRKMMQEQKKIDARDGVVYPVVIR
jgi:DNA replication protein DnaC